MERASPAGGEPPPRELRGRFATTRWSVVLAAGAGGSDASADALAELCERYWLPLYAYARRRGHDAEEARDVTQGFFVQLLERRALAVADPARGRFRSFLLTSMQRFLSSEWRKEAALKRGGAREQLPLDFGAAEKAYALEPAHELTPEALFERRFALALLARAVDELRADYARAGKRELFDALQGALGGGEERLPYAELARRLGRSEGSLRTAASRLRARWGETLRALVAETVGDEAEVEDELRRLVAALEAGL